MSPRRPAIRTVSVRATLAMAMLGLAACTGPGGSPGARADVQVTLTDFAITTSTATVPAGQVRFVITNTAANIHEIEVFAVPDGVDPAQLAVTENAADTAAAGLIVVDEVEDIAPSTVASLTVTLQPGRYALICNLPTHYQLGMHTVVAVR